MSRGVYFNEHDKYAAQWLRNLIAAGHLPAGDVDDRDIREVRASDLDGYDQCHFFAGIGGWPLALRMAGWDDARPVWTGSCPCQPFSAAGKRKGTADSRHLWPEFLRLIAECRPPVVAGEQVASKDGRDWLSGVRADLEALGYAVGAADLCAAGVGAPHIRQRLFWVADAEPQHDRRGAPRQGGRAELADSGATGRLADADQGQCRRLADGEGRQRDREALGWVEGDRQPEPSGATRWVGDADRAVTELASGNGAGPCEAKGGRARGQSDGPSAPGSWSRAGWLPCTDGKARRVEPGVQPLAHGAASRVGRLRAYGNAIVPQVAAEFIGAFLDVRAAA